MVGAWLSLQPEYLAFCSTTAGLEGAASALPTSMITWAKTSQSGVATVGSYGVLKRAGRLLYLEGGHKEQVKGYPKGAQSTPCVSWSTSLPGWSHWAHRGG